MKVILFGATGMIGQGVLRECLLDPQVESVQAVTRSPLGRSDPKLRELIHEDFLDFSSVKSELAGYDACLFCLGVSSAGMSEADYTRVTYDFPMAAARALLEVNPDSTFVYISGASTDSSEKGRSMWARVKGKAENGLLALPFKGAYMFRPGFIQPLHGITSRTALYRIIYTVGWPLGVLARALAPRHTLTTESLARAMLEAAQNGAQERVLEAPAINDLAKKRSGRS